ncbi:DUF6461 domain-containing protein [Streptomyces sp. NPDC048473]|uniref:DUF6461 domain-containing protein n=1 Tax=unclassified Streptomyces TaxID=2593676 RepID=UPI00371731E5
MPNRLHPGRTPGPHPPDRLRVSGRTCPLDDYPAASAALALAEHLTQVRLTPELLQNTTFSCGSSEIW